MINDYRLTKVIIKNMLRKLLLGKKFGISTLNFSQNLVYLNLQIHSKDFSLILQMIGQSKGDKSEYFEKLPIDSGMGHFGK